MLYLRKYIYILGFSTALISIQAVNARSSMLKKDYCNISAIYHFNYYANLLLPVPRIRHFSLYSDIKCNLNVSLRKVSYLNVKSIYFNQNSNLTNIDFSFNIADSRLALFPELFSNQVWTWQRFVTKTYLSGLRFLERLNPLPGYRYYFVTRSPAYPYLFMSTIDTLAYDKRTFPFTEDLNFQNTDRLKRSYGFGLTMVLF